MSWKKSLLYFAWQSIRFSENLEHFNNIWSYYSRWKTSFEPGKSSVKDELPWINFLAINCLQNNIRPEFKVFEFGGGGSTLFFSKIVAEIATVEDNLDWYNTLNEIIASRGITNWKGFFVQPEPVSSSSTRSFKNPKDFMSRMEIHADMSFEKYAKAIHHYPLEYFDLILVDGRARPSCIEQALPFLKSGGILVVDNTERSYYLEPFKEVLSSDFEVLEDRIAPVSYTPDFTRTSIFRKKVK
ncbi:MAG TPA: hypothetical protein VK168_02650 [Saprospiraceae bacterium]|nr:hypothetical protein [Saprospiraceae bacterium]